MIAYGCSTTETKRVERVKFYVPSADEIRKLSVVEVTETTMFSRGLPSPMSLSDARMGTVDRRILCATCGLDCLHCQGHPGHIELPFPMYHSTFFDIVLKMLRCTCFMCSRLSLTPPEAKALGEAARGRHRLAAVYPVAKTRKRCHSCGAPRPTFTRLSMGIRVDWPVDMEWESDEEREYCTSPFTQRDAFSILSNMTDEDCELLGFDPVDSHPRNMIMHAVIVPPPSVRPTILASEGSKTRGCDDLTQKLQEVIKRAADLRTDMGGTSWRDVAYTPAFHERVQRLQYEVFTLVNNTVRGQRQSVQRSGVPTKSYIGRIKGKDGRIRGNLMGKRVDHCARSVISPGPMLDIDQVGVPVAIASTLTVPELVTPSNIARLTERVRVGAGDVMGAETVISSDGVVVDLSQCNVRHKLWLQPGWTVERYLQDDDVVAFNRQPSLHKQGLMGHRVKLVRDLTFRLNLSVTAPYNADFDGDEMNLHVPQSDTARASVALLMMVTDQLLSPQANKPCMGIVQDSLVGLYRITRPTEFVNRDDAAHILAHLKGRPIDRLPQPALWVRGRPVWTGKQLVSHVLPCGVYVERAPARVKTVEESLLHDLDSPVVRDGEVVAGRLNKAVLGTAAGGLVDVMCRTDTLVAATALAELQRLAIAYNGLRGFSVGLSDCVLSAEGRAAVDSRISQATALADEITREMSHDDIAPDNAALAEKTIRGILSKALMQAGNVVEKHLSTDNAVRNMVMSGSKGSPINLAQIGACVGQQSVEGKRIVPEKGDRTLPCFAPGDRALCAMGFVRSSYVDGLEPHEFYYHAMGGREGLVDTAVKTSETGYLQRRQVKAMESHGVRHDGTVRNAADDIVQFVYAGVGYDPAKLERVKVRMDEPVASVQGRMLADDARRVLEARNAVLASAVCLGAEVDNRITVPVNPSRLSHAHGIFEGEAEVSIAEAEAFVAMVDSIEDDALRYVLHEAFPSAKLRRVPANGISSLTRAITFAVEAACVPAGEMVGCIAAQSVGEPTTQLTLNSTSHAHSHVLTPHLSDDLTWSHERLHFSNLRPISETFSL